MSKKNNSNTSKSKNNTLGKKEQDFTVEGQKSENNLFVTQEHVKNILDEELQKRFDRFEDRLITDKASLITVFGIFASIVAFLSIEIQILKTICAYWKVAGFSLIILASLLSFVLILHFIGQTWAKNDQKQKFPWEIAMIVMFLFIVGVVFSTLGNENSCIENSIYRRYENTFIDKQFELEKRYDNTINTLQEEIEGLKEQVRQNKQ